MRAACLFALAFRVSAFHAVSPAARTVPTRWRRPTPMLSAFPDDDALAAALRARREELERERSSLEQEASAPDQRTEPEPTPVEPLGPTVPTYPPGSGGPVQADRPVAPPADGPTTAAGAGLACAPAEAAETARVVAAGDGCAAGRRAGAGWIAVVRCACSAVGA